MKNYLRILAFALAAVFVFAACDSSGDDDAAPPPPPPPPPPADVDNPAKGEMTAATAEKIFVTSEVEGGVQIDQFKDLAALTAYIDAGSQAADAPAKPKKAPGDKTLVLNKIAGAFIVSIADNAFKPNDAGTNILTGFNVKLPEKLASIGENSFTGAGIITLFVSETVKTALGDALTTAANNADTEAVAVAADEEDDDAPSLGDGVYVQPDGSLYISAVIYDSTGTEEFKENKYVGAWNGDSDNPPELVIPKTNEYAVSGGWLTITIPFGLVPAVPVWEDATVTPQNLRICELALFGMNAPGYEPEYDPDPDKDTREAHALRLCLGDESQGMLIYADQDGTVIGDDRNMRLRAGWNFVMWNNSENILKNGSPEGFRWRFPDLLNN